MSATFSLTMEQAAQRDAFVERMLKSTAGLFDIFSIYIGDRLGYYQALAKGEAITSPELAKQTGTHERYAREWLEQQTVIGILEVENPAAAATARRFRLPAPHAEVLAERDSLNYLAPLAQLAVGAGLPIHAVLNAFRTGWSVLHCLPVGMADPPATGTGTVMRTDTLRRYAQEAGLRDIEVLPIDNFFFRFYRLMT